MAFAANGLLRAGLIILVVLLVVQTLACAFGVASFFGNFIDVEITSQSPFEKKWKITCLSDAVYALLVLLLGVFGTLYPSKYVLILFQVLAWLSILFSIGNASFVLATGLIHYWNSMIAISSIPTFMTVPFKIWVAVIAAMSTRKLYTTNAFQVDWTAGQLDSSDEYHFQSGELPTDTPD